MQIHAHTVILFVLVLFTLLVPIVQPASYADPPLNVLILSGQNNHDWRTTTPAIEELLVRTGRFTVSVLDQPETMTGALLEPFDVVVSNWNVRGSDPDIDEWPEPAHTALQAFVRNGKGHVTFHAGASSHYDRPEYQELGLVWWDIDISGHGPKHTFPVSITDRDHPITQGLQPFMMYDELWHRAGIRSGAQILATGFSSESMKGSGSAEPVVVVAPLEAGRTAALVLGHDTRSLANPSCAALLARCIEWAATGEVTLPPPHTGWTQTNGDLTYTRNGEVLWRFRASSDLAKPYFDPLRPEAGPSLTWDEPPDHIWHHGLWFSWKTINGANYWESPESGTPEGLTLWDPPSFITHDDGSAGILINLRYQDPAGTIVLREKREIQVAAPDSLGGFTIDWHSVLTAQDIDLLLDRTPIIGQPDGVVWGGYAGLTIRMPDMEEHAVVTEAGPVEIPNGMGEIVARVMDYSGIIEEQRAGVAILPFPGHPSPLSWYAISQPEVPFYWFNPAIIYRAPLALASGESLTLAYHIAIHHDAWDADTLSAEWERIQDPAGTQVPTGEATP